ncbi:hypothetical protein EB796_016552 [Bugula neritina]|uniref:Uncharacterized protein n=1 Tax=Bugula neritina TaxID=10212 RepID=A0A7J7JFP8_BUGNE|nr:hypothetical protein EB796_016552 [Bugula neritina]
MELQAIGSHLAVWTYEVGTILAAGAMALDKAIDKSLFLENISTLSEVMIRPAETSANTAILFTSYDRRVTGPGIATCYRNTQLR